jgi:multiple sugar transport system ATP-binding protein
MRAEIRELHRRTKASMVYVTHDQEEAMTLADRMVVMKFGVVQQFGTPGECYARPANRFVAGFVGTPVMNFIEGRVDGGVFVSADLRVQLSAARWPRMPAGPATLGVRPDQLRVLHSTDAGAGSTAADGTSVPATVRAIERLGDRMDVAVMIGGTRLTARIENDDRLVEGGSVLVHIGLGAAHLFASGEDGARLADAHDVA